MREVDLQYAETHLAHLIDKAVAGEDVVITRDKDTLVRLTPVYAPSGERVFGMDKGKVVIPEDFDEPDPELEKLFYGDADPS